MHIHTEEAFKTFHSTWRNTQNKSAIEMDNLWKQKCTTTTTTNMTVKLIF